MQSSYSKTLAKTLALLFGVWVCGGIAAAISFARGGVSPRMLGVASIFMFVATGVVITIVFRRLAKTDAHLTQSSYELVDKRKNLRSIWIFRAAVAFLTINLIYGLWKTQSAPLWERVVPATISILFISGFVVSLVRMHRNRKQG